MITHYPTCTPDYPEKPKGDKPQQIEVIDLEEDGEEVHICSDCGASEIVKKATE